MNPLLLGFFGCPGPDADSGADSEAGDSSPDTDDSTDTTDSDSGDSDTGDRTDSDGTADSDTGDTDTGDPVDTGPELSVSVVAEDVEAAKLLGAEDDIVVMTYADLHMAAAGDLDGDGVGDLVANLPSREISGYAGAYFVVSGTVRGVGDFGAMADAAIYNQDDVGAPDDPGYLGMAAASAGDVDGDGLDELMVAEINYDADPSTEAYPGAVFILDGPLTGDVPLSTATAILVGMERDPDESLPSSITGEFLAPLGDTNDDGYDDILVSSNFADGGASGAIFLVTGPMTGELALGTDSAMRLFPEADHVKAGAAAGDVDADGFDDFLALQPYAEVGAVILFSGSTTGDVYPSDADTVFSATTEDAIAGYGAHGVGDVNEDGYDDLAFMDSGDETGGSAAGAIALHHGPFASAEEAGPGDSNYIGTEDSNTFACVNAGDIDGDGREDLAFAASEGGSSGPGTVHVELGPIHTGSGSAEDANITISGSDQDEFGILLAAAGDVDLDGLADLWVGATGDEEGGEYSGAVFLILGSSLR